MSLEEQPQPVAPAVEPQPPADAAPAAVAVREPSPAEQLVDVWFQDTFYNLPIDPPLFSRFYAAKEALKERLAALLRE